MGCLVSRDGNVSRSIQIDSMLRTYHHEYNNELRILLLGAGESGKSTIQKQFRILLACGYSEQDRAAFLPIVAANLYLALSTLSQACVKMDLQVQPENQATFEFFLNTSESKILSTKFDADLGQALKLLWLDSAIQEAFTKKGELHLADSVEYFFGSIDRIIQPGYVPTIKDVVRARTKTTGIHELRFTMNERKCIVVDVGGQRTERKKWIHCFNNVTTIIYCVALSEYDLRLREDNATNRMHESLALFEQTVHLPCFDEIPFILFFNKADLFKEKIKTVDLSDCFPNYTGGCEYENAIEYIQTKFKAANKPHTKLYCHVTTATSTTNIQVVLRAVCEIILRHSLMASHLV